MENKHTCPYCHSQTKQWKAGKGSSSGSQRYRCGECGRRYTRVPKEHGYDEATRREAVKLYLDGGNYRRVGRTLGVDRVSVMNWVRDQAQRTPPKAPLPADSPVIEMDELFTHRAPKWDKKRALPCHVKDKT
jgi:transposase-like protein